MYKPRTYRSRIGEKGLVSFEVVEGETDLLISAGENLAPQARESVINYRQEIHSYITIHPDFLTSLEPVTLRGAAPAIVRAMANASCKAGVGPMAAVAGAMAEFVGRDLAAYTDEIIAENGGDIFIKAAREIRIGVYAGEDSPFTGKLALCVRPSENGTGVCTSSGTVSHSLSLGRADAALVISDDTALADAVATSTANLVKTKDDVGKAIEFGKSITGVKGILVIIGETLGSWGEMTLV